MVTVTLRVIRHERQDYPESVQEQESIVADLLAGRCGNTLIITEHPPVFTLGTSAQPSDVLQRHFDDADVAVHDTGRGGEVTYHGPGQLVCYMIADLREARDLHRHVQQLEAMVINTLSDLGLHGERSPRGIGVWLGNNKIAAVGVRCRRWITFHGIALNNNTNLNHFSGIIPCGMRDAPVTSLRHEGVMIDRPTLEGHLIHHARCFW
ncbi:MAG: lipoyl(octanoyl) transferase LipB [Mariprofundaceae bacterium]|nr:lipoyl(octanoyl) transferase LipB [Mariprofundaceae bacterium]